jgi:DNA polymerase (family X)
MSEDEPRPNANAEVARLFAEIGDILELKGEQPYRYNAYRTAARSVGNARERLDVLFQQGRLRELYGVGSALEAKIVEYLSTGQMEFYERVRREFPSALASLLQVPGLGPGKARALYQELGVSTTAELEEAARSGRIKDVPGFGDKVAEMVLESLERLKQRTTRHLLADGWLAATEIQEALGNPTEADRIAVVGSVRRMCESIGDLDLLAARDPHDDGERLIQGLVALPNLVQVLERTAEHVRIQIYGGLEVQLIVVPRDAWGCALAWYTGSETHVARLEALAEERGWQLSDLGLEDAATGKRIAGDSEVEVYERLGLAWIPPELREDTGEIEAAQAGTLPELIDIDDIKGDLHCHTNWTDGTQTLDEMAKAAKARGYQYMALTDHSQNLALTRGLNPERLREQRALVNRLNHKLAPFVVLLGTEMDILLDGQLDFADDVLAELEYVSASVHSGFRQSEKAMTARIQRAISNPLVNTLNHPHGRKIGRREGYAVDMQAVAEMAARLGCALELNADPSRLDLNGDWARRARQLGARFTVSSDAHSVSNYDFMQFGIGTARRGWLTASDVLNTRPLDELRQLLKQRRAHPTNVGI